MMNHADGDRLRGLGIQQCGIAVPTCPKMGQMLARQNWDAIKSTLHRDIRLMAEGYAVVNTLILQHRLGRATAYASHGVQAQPGT
jgi:hypothetical protein